MPGPVIKLKPLPTWADPSKPSSSLMEKMIKGATQVIGADDPESQLMGIVSPLGMALDPIQKIMAKRALESMAIGQMPARNTADILRQVGATAQDIGNLIPELPSQIRGQVRSLLSSGRGSGSRPWKGKIPLAETTASPTKRISNDVQVGRQYRQKASVDIKDKPNTMGEWLKQYRDNPKTVRRFGQDPTEINQMLAFLEPMLGTKKRSEILKMSLDEFRPIYKELLEKTGWEPK